MVGSDGSVYAFGGAQYLGGATSSLGNASAIDIEPTPTGNGYWIVDHAGHVFGYGDARSLGNADTRGLAAGETVTSLSATPTGDGYWFFTSRGRVLPMGDARHLGDMSAEPLNGPVFDSIPTPSGEGYYMVASDGGVFSFEAPFRGSMGSVRLNEPVTGMVPFGNGYLMVATDGGIFNFSNLPFFGSLGSNPPANPIVAVAALDV